MCRRGIRGDSPLPWVKLEASDTVRPPASPSRLDRGRPLLRKADRASRANRSRPPQRMPGHAHCQHSRRGIPIARGRKARNSDHARADQPPPNPLMERGYRLKARRSIQYWRIFSSVGTRGSELDKSDGSCAVLVAALCWDLLAWRPSHRLLVCLVGPSPAHPPSLETTRGESPAKGGRCEELVENPVVDRSRGGLRRPARRSRPRSPAVLHVLGERLSRKPVAGWNRERYCQKLWMGMIKRPPSPRRGDRLVRPAPHRRTGRLPGRAGAVLHRPASSSAPGPFGEACRPS
jgi:hypothetical protein